MADLEMNDFNDRPDTTGQHEALNGEDEDIEWNGLLLEDDYPYEDMEKLYDYEPEGHHPVHLGDRLGPQGRYQVVHKLGSGGFANVWMCKDLENAAPKYVALKILMAWASKEPCSELRSIALRDQGVQQERSGHHICLPEHHFQIDGPNGQHVCMVYPVLGPRVSWLWQPSMIPGATLRRIARHAAAAMSTLHKHGVCHGDFSPKNVLLRLSPLDGLSEEQVLEIFGQPKRLRVLTSDGESPTDASSPHYLVRPVDFSTPQAAHRILHEACIIDFGESYQIASPPEDLGIPFYYRSPEFIIDKTIGIANDMWALACTIFELRTGRKLFDAFDGDDDEQLYNIVMTLGPLPEPWWSNNWEPRKEIFEDAPDESGRAVKVNKEPPRPGDRSEARSIRDTLMWSLPGEIQMIDGREAMMDRGIPTDPWLTLDQEEIDVFADLLEKMLKYKSEGRPSVEEVLQHPWFNI